MANPFNYPNLNTGTMGNQYFNDLVKRGIIMPGQSVPGYNPAQTPRLLTPSMQYWSRMGPQQQQQYQGYMRAQTGAIPEQSQWSVWRMAPPGGQNPGLRYQR